MVESPYGNLLGMVSGAQGMRSPVLRRSAEKTEKTRRSHRSAVVVPTIPLESSHVAKLVAERKLLPINGNET
jgi:hypothetical protein